MNIQHMFLSLVKKQRLTLIILGVLLIAITAAGKVFPQQEEITFEGGQWNEVAAEAKKSGRYIFVDAYASWCAPCKLLKATTFKEENTAAYFNKNFVNYTVDLEQGEGLELAEQWEVDAYPTLLFFSPEGKMVLKQIGYVDGKKLLEIGQEVLQKGE